jgi:hypothetical protein
MARHSAALTSEGNLPPQSRPSRPRGLNLVDERGSPVFEEQSSFGLAFALGALTLITGVIFTALIVTGKVGQPSLNESAPPRPLPSTLLQMSVDERLPAEALERAQVTAARLPAPVVTVTAGPASGGDTRRAPTSGAEADDAPY